MDTSATTSARNSEGPLLVSTTVQTSCVGRVPVYDRIIPDCFVLWLPMLTSLRSLTRGRLAVRIRRLCYGTDTPERVHSSVFRCINSRSFVSLPSVKNDSDAGPLLFQNAHKYSQSTAIIDQHGTYSYSDLLRDSKTIAQCFLAHAHVLTERRVVFLFPRDYSYVATQWAIWR